MVIKIILKKRFEKTKLKKNAKKTFCKRKLKMRLKNVLQKSIANKFFFFAKKIFVQKNISKNVVQKMCLQKCFSKTGFGKNV